MTRDVAEVTLDSHLHFPVPVPKGGYSRETLPSKASMRKPPVLNSASKKQPHQDFPPCSPGRVTMRKEEVSGRRCAGTTPMQAINKADGNYSAFPYWPKAGTRPTKYTRGIFRQFRALGSSPSSPRMASVVTVANGRIPSSCGATASVALTPPAPFLSTSF